MPLPAGLLAEFDSASVNAASVTFQGTSRVADIALAELITNSSRGQVSVGQRTVANAIGFTADLHLADSALQAPQTSLGPPVNGGTSSLGARCCTAAPLVVGEPARTA